MSLYPYIICSVIVFSLISPASADNIAIVHGAVYEIDTFKPLNNSVIEVNSTPVQYLVAKNGQYSIKLMPGNYTIKVRYYKDKVLVSAKEDTITIEDGGDYVYDLLLPQVNYENLQENAKKPIVDTPIERTFNFDDVSTNNQPRETVAEIQKVADEPISSNSTDNLQTTENILSRITHPINFLLIGLASFFILMGSFLLFKNHNKIINNNSKNGSNELKIRTLFNPINMLKALAKISTKDNGSGAKHNFKGNNQEAVSVREEESGVQERNITNMENPPARETKLAVSMSEEEKTRVLLEELLCNPENYVHKKTPPIPENLKEVMDVIKARGGIISQKELRSKLDYSEVKVSVMLTDLEKMKRIKKFKRGRENFVILVDWNQ